MRPAVPTGNEVFGKTLRAMRGRMPAQLAAARCGVSKELWSHYEHGIRRPDADALYAMSKLFRKNMSALYELASPIQAQQARETIAS